MSVSFDLRPFYVDFGVEVTHTPKAGGASTAALAIHDLPGTVIYDGSVAATDHTLRYPRASFPAVARGDAFAIGGVPFTVRDAPQALLDGAECVVALRPA